MKKYVLNRDIFHLFSAPMEEVSERAFRKLAHRHGAHLTFTEMSRADALARKSSSTLRRIECDGITPTVIQLLAANEDKLAQFLKNFHPPEQFFGFNLNLGCPSPQIIQLGQGSAMVKRIQKVQRLVNIIREHGYPISLKLRLGQNQFEKDKKVYLNLINGVDADFFIVHARDGAQTYSDKADYNAFRECVKTNKIIIANGDVHTVDQLNELKNIGVHGVMVGRAAVKDPSIFNTLNGIIVSPEDLKKEYMELAEEFKTPQKYKDNVLSRIGKPFVANPLPNVPSMG